MTMKKLALVLLVAASLSAAAYGEAYSTSFEYADVAAMEADGWQLTQHDPHFTTTTVRSGSKALVLSPRVCVERPLEEFGTLKLWVYDEGTINTSNADGPRWGLSKGEECIAGEFFHRSFMSSAVAYGVNTGFSNNTKLGQWFSSTWMDAGDVTSPGGEDDSRSRGVPGWMEWEIAYYPDGTIEINLLTDPNGGGPKAYSGREVGVPGPVATTGDYPSVEFVDPATGGADTIYLFGSWNNPSLFGDLIVDDLTWTPYEGGVCNPGDADGDLDVDLDDFAILKLNFGTTEGADCSTGDFDGDGDVDLDDFALLKTNFGTTY